MPNNLLTTQDNRCDCWVLMPLFQIGCDSVLRLANASDLRLLFNKFQSRFLGRGCDETLFSEKKGFSVKRGEAIQ